MSPIDYIPRTRELYPDTAPYRWVYNEDIPWTPLTKPLQESKVVLMSSGGVYHRDQEPFHFKNDASFREIPRDTAVSDMSVSHFGYQIDDAVKDPNCVFPLERMRELEQEGLFGSLAERAFSFMGGIYSVRRVQQRLAPQLLEHVQDLKADLVYLVPA
jgi:D-proline reductase (dithiol) PrdB